MTPIDFITQLLVGVDDKLTQQNKNSLKLNGILLKG